MIDFLKDGVQRCLEILKTIKNHRKQQLYTDIIKSNKKILLLKQWIYLYQYNIKIHHWLRKKRKNTVAVYGMADLGQLLCYDLIDNNIEVKYTIDESYEYKNSEVPIYPLNENLEPVDVVIVTLINPSKRLLNSIKNNTKSDVITLERVIERLIRDITL